MNTFLITGVSVLLALHGVIAGETPSQVELEADFLEFRSADIQDLARTGTVDTKALQKLREKGRADLLFAPLRLATVSGEEASVRAVTEHVYPTGFDVIRIRDIPNTNETIQPLASIGSVVQPSGFETRDVGVILTSTPVVLDNGTSIRIDLTAQVVYLVEPLVYIGKHIDSQGKATEVKLDQPVFRTFAINTKVLLDNGTMTFFGSLDNITEKKVLVMFLTARIVKPEGAPSQEK